jgi:hypothetical protein
MFIVVAVPPERQQVTLRQLQPADIVCEERLEHDKNPIITFYLKKLIGI